MLLLHGGDRIEENDHRQHGKAQTFVHTDPTRISVDERGQGNGERTRITNRLANLSPPAAALSSHVLHRDSAIGCASAASAHRREVQQQQAPTQTSCAATSRLPGRIGSLRERHWRREAHGPERWQREPRHRRGEKLAWAMAFSNGWGLKRDLFHH